ncbi:CHRD domain-containing protein [Synechococcales cyanobacterium C]|uniref:CHRD domain-containing protein n=1 Tax=Petrachloros mirabilis ULC683 TaxID=2781853 RepID=A0A8K1ZWZ3_9CYAN|nr:CHRD domain-containing protein [Petrachloros mirabilis]NCJ05576.1 CHRD domain-containing protein [Petrachloros mirabilis ULC683]
MNKVRRSLLNIFLGTVTCLLLIGSANVPLMHHAVARVDPTPAAQGLSSAALVANLNKAESTLMAQGTARPGLTRYVAVLTRSQVVPTMPSTSAFGAAGAALVGNRLVVRGDFSNLAGALRDYATDPLDPPNPNITSAVHIHQGAPDVNGPFKYALTVTPDSTERAGRFSGEYNLTPEQLQALSNGELYVDIHTTRNRGGELRGIFRPY